VAQPAEPAPPARSQAPEPDRLRQLQGLILDCDGVLSDGGLFYDEAGRPILRFCARDGFVLSLLCRAGLKIGVLSGRPAGVAEARHAQLGMAPFVGSCRDKAAGFLQICQGWGVGPEQVALMGDDLPDLAGFRVAGLRIGVADAAPEVLGAADWVTSAHGGHGAVREVGEAIAKARGDWQAYLKKAQDLSRPA
jgi:3-deoxy-D-manno-octulosonate 8-phosphate phosphatase (KDO 8-P phosphatase)